MRYAIYFTPPEADPLSEAASRWLGRDAFTGQPVTGNETFRDATASPRKYGFHGTLKAPFRLRDDQTEAKLISAVKAFCAAEKPFDLPPLVVNRIGPFFALMPATPSEILSSFASRIVEAFEPFRAPLNNKEIARRGPERLSPEEREYLTRWGYPYVMESFRFHMTLTGPIADTDAPAIQRALHAWFPSELTEAVAVDALTVFLERKPGAPFSIIHQCPLGSHQSQDTLTT